MANDKALKLGFILSGTDKLSRVVDQAVKKSTDKLSAFERTNNKISQSMLKAGSLMVGAGVGVGAAMFGMAKSTAEYGDAVWKNSQAVGMNVEEYQRLAYAAKMSAVEETALTGALGKLNKKIIEASSGSKTAAKVFTDLGIKLKDQEGKLRAPSEVLSELSEIFARVEDGPEKAALAMELFGNTGAKLIPLLNSGKDGLEAWGNEAERMGLIMSEEAAKASEKFNDDLARVGNTVKGITIQFGTAFMPAINRGIEKINEITGKISGWIQANPKVTDTIAKVGFAVSGLLIGVGSLSIAIGAVTFIAGKFKSVYMGVMAAVKIGTALFKTAKSSMLLFRLQYVALVAGQKIAAAAQMLFNSTLMACPVMWIVGAIIAIGAAVYLLVKHWDKVKAFFIKLWDRLKAIFSKAWEWIKTMFLNYTPHGLIIKHWDSIVGWFVGLWTKVKSGVVAGWETIKRLFLNYTPHGLIIKHWDSIVGWFAGIWTKVKSGAAVGWETVKRLFLNYTPHGLIIKNWDSIAGWFAGLWQRVKAIFASAWGNITAMFRSMNPVEWIRGAWGGTGNFFSGLWAKVRNIFRTGWDNIKRLFLNYTPTG